MDAMSAPSHFAWFYAHVNMIFISNLYHLISVFTWSINIKQKLAWNLKPALMMEVDGIAQCCNFLEQT